MKQLPKALFNKSLDSLVLAIEHFNRPWDRGRHEAVLILLDRSFELLLKTLILHKGGKIREPYEKETIGFEKCVRKNINIDTHRLNNIKNHFFNILISSKHRHP